jgi:tetraacyldisaccharide 4'-kinase
MSALSQTLQHAWMKRGWLARLLWPLSQLYGALIGIRRWLFEHHWLSAYTADVPVVVVGNLVAGGAGKTPLVMAIVQHLQAAGRRPGVVSRGYGRLDQTCLEVLPHMPVRLCGDEPLLIKQRTGAPVFVAGRRSDALQALLAAHPDTDLVICDDGLQHYALRRDLNIAVFDDRGLGNGWLLPAGPLREVWPQPQLPLTAKGPQSVAPVHLTLHTGRQPAFAGFQSNRSLAREAVAADGTRVPLQSLQGEDLTALAAIANPGAFFDMLRQQGLRLTRTLALPDHDALSGVPIWDQRQRLLCTEKDAVKLFARYPQAGLMLLAVPLVFTPEPDFFQALDERLLPLLSPLPSSHGHQTS